MISPAINVKDILGPISSGISPSDILPPIPFTTQLPVSPEEMKEFCEEFNEVYQKSLEVLENATNADFYASQYEKAKSNVEEFLTEAKEETKQAIEDAKNEVREAIEDITNPEKDENGEEIGFFEKLTKDIVDAVSELTDDLLDMVQNALKIIYSLLSDCFGIGTETLKPYVEADLKGATKESLQAAGEAVGRAADKGVKIAGKAIISAGNYVEKGLTNAYENTVDAIFPYAITTMKNNSLSMRSTAFLFFKDFKGDDYISYYENFSDAFWNFRGVGSTAENSINALKDVMAFYLTCNVTDDSTYREAKNLKKQGITGIFEGFLPIEELVKKFYE